MVKNIIDKKWVRERERGKEEEKKQINGQLSQEKILNFTGKPLQR